MNLRRGSSVNRLRDKLLLACGIFLAGQGALAATSCRIMTGGSVAFGAYETMAAAATDTAAQVQVRCERDGGPPNVTLTMAISAGMHGASANARRMLHTGAAGDYLGYGLFRDVSRSSIWGSSPGVDTMSQTLTVPNKGSATATFVIYGRIPPLQNVSAGSYADSVQVTVSP